MRNLINFDDEFYSYRPRVIPFGKDRLYGTLYISEHGDVLIIDEDGIRKMPTERGGRESKYELIRWYDVESGLRKKAYISKLLREKFGENKG